MYAITGAFFHTDPESLSARQGITHHAFVDSAQQSIFQTAVPVVLPSSSCNAGISDNGDPNVTPSRVMSFLSGSWIMILDNHSF